MSLPYCEPFKIKMIESLRKSTHEERQEWIRQASYNLFNLRSEQVFIDLLTDSGTGAMSDKQWGAIMTGDESYAGASSYYNLKEAIREITGFEYFLQTHKRRAAENVLFSVLVKEGDIIPGNAHFDTTKGHIEFRKAKAVDCTVAVARDINSTDPFKGNVDLDLLGKVLEETPRQKLGCIVMTVTNNTSGGQPVSMANFRGVRALAERDYVKAHAHFVAEEQVSGSESLALYRAYCLCMAQRTSEAEELLKRRPLLGQAQRQHPILKAGLCLTRFDRHVQVQ